MSSMSLVANPVHYDHGSGQKCTALLVINVDSPENDSMQIDGEEVALNLLGVIVKTLRNNVQYDGSNSNGTWHYPSECTR